MKRMIKSMPFSTKPFAMFPFKSCVKKVYMLKKLKCSSVSETALCVNKRYQKAVHFSGVIIKTKNRYLVMGPCYWWN